MGCFLQCFGLSKKRKRRKTLYKVLAAAAAIDQNHGNYEALDSSLSVNLAITENPIIPCSNFSDEYKEKTRVKSRKKVSFNLNVQIYEPNPTDYQILESDEEEEEKEEGNGEMGKSSSSSSNLGEKPAALKYPSNHRYYSYIDSYNEEDEIVDEESDIDAYDDDDEFDEEGGWYDGSSDGNASEEEDWAEVYNENTVQKQSCEPKYSSLEKERSKNHEHSVLSPVENLTQWKAIKAKVAPSKHGRKENVPLEQKTGFNLLESKVLQSKPLLSEIAVDASFSNWFISPNVSKTTIHCQ